MLARVSLLRALFCFYHQTWTACFILALTIFDLSPYHYIPTKYVTIIFVVLFGLSTCKYDPSLLSPKGIFFLMDSYFFRHFF